LVSTVTATIGQPARKAALHEPITPQREERVDGRNRVVRLQGGIDQTGDEVPACATTSSKSCVRPPGKW
jgi:hypothetical protein